MSLFVMVRSAEAVTVVVIAAVFGPGPGSSVVERTDAVLVSTSLSEGRMQLFCVL